MPPPVMIGSKTNSQRELSKKLRTRRLQMASDNLDKLWEQRDENHKEDFIKREEIKEEYEETIDDCEKELDEATKEWEEDEVICQTIE